MFFGEHRKMPVGIKRKAAHERNGKVYNPDHLLYERLPDFHLSDLGRRMAQATAAYLANSPQTNTISAVYSSPLDRTRETADAILDALNPVREARGEAPLMLTADERVIEAGNEFRGKRISTLRSAWMISHARRSPNTPANRLWWSATNRRFSVIAIIWRPATPSTGCSCGTRRSPP